VGFRDGLRALRLRGRGGYLVQGRDMAAPWVRISVVFVCSLQLRGVEPPSVGLSRGVARSTSTADSQREVPGGPQHQLAQTAALVLVNGAAGGDGCEWILTRERLWPGFLFSFFSCHTHRLSLGCDSQPGIFHSIFATRNANSAGPINVL